LQVGFDIIDAFAKSQGISLTTHHFKALFGEGLAPSIFLLKNVCLYLLMNGNLSIDAGVVDGIPVLLAKPQTYIYLSG
jgi:PTH1 family peptidyl-tRNA hydrolase